jgi:hypothetical protein
MDVVFDTNAYRVLTYGKQLETVRRDFDAITGAEQAKGFRVFMANVPWMELFSHLADLLDPAFDDCLKAVVGSYIHSRIDGRFTRGKIMPSWQMLISHELFGPPREEHAKTVFALDDTAIAIAAAPSVNTVKAHMEQLKSIRAFSEGIEDKFMDTFREKHQEFHELPKDRKKSLIRTFKHENVHMAWEYVILIQAAEAAGADLTQFSEAELETKLARIRKRFPAPSHLVKIIMSKMVGHHDFNIENNNRKNWYWDYQMLFYIAEELQLFLVTSDGDMVDAARDAGIDNRVIPVKEYLALLNLNIQTG